MNRKWLVVGLMVLVVVGMAVGVRQLVAKDEAGKADEPKKLVDEMMAKLKVEDYKGFVEAAQAFNSGVYSDDERKAMEYDPKNSPKVGAAMLQAVIDKAPGKFTGEVELVGKEGVGSGFVRYLFLQRFERGALVYKPTFYRTPRGWLLCELNYDSNLAAHLKPVP